MTLLGSIRDRYGVFTPWRLHGFSGTGHHHLRCESGRSFAALSSTCPSFGCEVWDLPVGGGGQPCEDRVRLPWWLCAGRLWVKGPPLQVEKGIEAFPGWQERVRDRP